MLRKPARMPTFFRRGADALGDALDYSGFGPSAASRPSHPIRRAAHSFRPSCGSVTTSRDRQSCELTRPVPSGFSISVEGQESGSGVGNPGVYVVAAGAKV